MSKGSALRGLTLAVLFFCGLRDRGAEFPKLWKLRKVRRVEGDVSALGDGLIDGDLHGIERCRGEGGWNTRRCASDYQEDFA